MVTVGYMLCCDNKELRLTLDSHTWHIEGKDSVHIMKCIYCDEKIELRYKDNNIEIITDIDIIKLCQRV